MTFQRYLAKKEREIDVTEKTSRDRAILIAAASRAADELEAFPELAHVWQLLRAAVDHAEKVQS